MVRKKIDNRIRILIDNCVATRFRSMFVVVGEKARDQVVILHHMLSKAEVKARPSVLWTYKKELGFSTHRKKRMRQLKKKIQSGKMAINEDDPFELFISSTNIRYCYYHETYKILGQTFGMAILQDFETLTPTLLARIIETVEGGGMVIILLQSLTCIKQLLTMATDLLARYRPNSHDSVIRRFSERLILSLFSCNNCLIIDDQLRVLPVSPTASKIKPVPPKSLDDPLTPEQEELQHLRTSLRDNQPFGVLVDLCRTADQAKAFLKFVDVLADKKLCSVVALTSARGRGKSAAMGLAVAGAVALGYSNIYVTSPHPENLKTLFEFLVKGFDALGYECPRDYEVTQSDITDHNKAVVRVRITRDRRQTVQYIHPADNYKLSQAELLVIDEAAAIPLPIVNKLFGPYLVFLASTISGYEGTGKSLSLKLLSKLRQECMPLNNKQSVNSFDSNQMSAVTRSRAFFELSLSESIRYQNGDAVEAWLNKLLCFDSSLPKLPMNLPPPEQCELYYLNRDTLFSNHEAAEKFLHSLVGLLFASDYRNSPNDLLYMSDAPANHVFCLLAPSNDKKRKLPTILSVILVSFEGGIYKTAIESSHVRYRSSDISEMLSEQFHDEDFKLLTGVRISRIATHPNCQRRGYGLRALQLLQEYFEAKIPVLKEVTQNTLHIITEDDESETLDVEPSYDKPTLPPLFLKLNERHPEKADYMALSFGLTAELLRFWKKADFVPVYLHETSNALTGEHSCIMLKTLDSSMVEDTTWLCEYFKRFRRSIIFKLHWRFRTLSSSLILDVLSNKNKGNTSKVLTEEELFDFLKPEQIKYLKVCLNNDDLYHPIMQFKTLIGHLYFLRYLGDFNLSQKEETILLSVSLLHKKPQQVSEETHLSVSDVCNLFRESATKIIKHLYCVIKLS